jgi:hypothetical protein
MGGLVPVLGAAAKPRVRFRMAVREREAAPAIVVSPWGIDPDRVFHPEGKSGLNSFRTGRNIEGARGAQRASVLELVRGMLAQVPNL